MKTEPFLLRFVTLLLCMSPSANAASRTWDGSAVFGWFPRKATFLLFSVAVLLAGGAAVRGQSALDGFDPNANDGVFSIEMQGDAKIVVGGRFTNIGGQTRRLFARLGNDTAALQNLAVTRTTVSWTRGGSSPLLERVTFESSTGNVNYSFLGNGIPQSGSSNWTLTGFSLPTGTNIWGAISPPYAVSGTNNVVTNATTEAQKFYRLSKP